MLTKNTRKHLMSFLAGAGLSLLGLSSQAQNLYINGGIFHMAANSNTYVLGNLFLENTNVTGPGRMHMVGASAQTVSGNDSSISRLVINNANHVSLLSNVGISDTMFLTAGRVILGINHLYMHNNAGFGGAPFDATRMVVADTSGTVRVGFGAAVTKLVPIGDVTGTSEYSPVSIVMSSGTFTGFRPHLAVNLRDRIHPNILDPSATLSRFWSINASGITAFSITPTFSYLDADIVGTETDLSGQKWNSSWTTFSAVDHSNNQFTTSGVTSLSDFTAGGSIVVFAKALLQGAYSSGGNMKLDLRMGNAVGTTNLLPAAQPYNIAPWNYSGGENKDTGTMGSTVVDWVLVELRSTFNGTPVTNGRRAGLVLQNGNIADTSGTFGLRFPGVPSGFYYIVVRHRNHLAVMSRDSIELTASTPVFDFTDAQSKAYGTNAMASLGGGVFGLIAGDATSNGIVAYIGTGSDGASVNTAVGVFTPGNILLNVYNRNDMNFDRVVSYLGTGNDRARVLTTVGTFTPGNTVLTQVP